MYTYWIHSSAAKKSFFGVRVKKDLPFEGRTATTFIELKPSHLIPWCVIMIRYDTERRREDILCICVFHLWTWWWSSSSFMMILCMHLFILVSYIHESSNTIRRWFSSNKKHAVGYVMLSLLFCSIQIIIITTHTHHITQSYHHHDKHDDHTYQHTWCPNIKKIYIKQSIFLKRYVKYQFFLPLFTGWWYIQGCFLRIIGHA